MLLPILCLAPIVCDTARVKPISGYLTINSICGQLQKATGKPHDFDEVFSDQAIYFRLRESTPERLKNLIATCLRGHWSQSGQRWRLVPNSRPAMPDWFSVAWSQSFENMVPAGLKIPDPAAVYAMQIGEQKVVDGQAIRRWNGTKFAWKFGSGQILNPQTDLNSSLGERSLAVVNLPKITKPIRGIDVNWSGEEPTLWTKGGTDLLCFRSAATISALANSVGGEFAVVMPDGIDSILTDPGFMNVRPRVKDVLRRFSSQIDFSIRQDVLIGQVAAIDAGFRTQASRDGLVKTCAARPIFYDTPTLAEFDAHQPSLASESGTSLYALNHAGALVDGDIGFPWSMRVYRSLTPTDWKKIRGGATVADLSPAAQTALDNYDRNRDKTSEGTLTSEFGPIGHEKVPRTASMKLEESTDLGFATYVFGQIPEYEDLRTLAVMITHRSFKAKDHRYVPFRQRTQTLTIGTNLKFDFWELGKVLTRRPVAYRELPPDVLRDIERMKVGVKDIRDNP